MLYPQRFSFQKILLGKELGEKRAEWYNGLNFSLKFRKTQREIRMFYLQFLHFTF